MGTWTTRKHEASHGTHSVTMGVTDLMTSLAVIFILLLVVFVNASKPAEAQPQRQEPGTAGAPSGLSTGDQVRASLQAQLRQQGLTLENDLRDPSVLKVAVPETFLTFEFGKSDLTVEGERFLAEMMPPYATMLCGPLRKHVEGVVIEGHTDDVGGDVQNLRLSQERSFRVMVYGVEAVRRSAPSAEACFTELASASGRGKQDLVYNGDETPNREQSRRVVFKIRLRGTEG